MLEIKMTRHEAFVLEQVLDALAEGKKISIGSVRYEYGLNGWEALMSVASELIIALNFDSK